MTRTTLASLSCSSFWVSVYPSENTFTAPNTRVASVRNFDADGSTFAADSDRPRGAVASGSRWESDWELPKLTFTDTVTKESVRTRLQWFLEVFPDINPSRAVLNRVNEYLMALKKRQVV